ncbi:hypothetical protein D3C72_801410 [compost metagenome]
MGVFASRGVKLSVSMSARKAWGRAVGAPSPRDTFTVGISWRKFDTLQRIAGNWK